MTFSLLVSDRIAAERASCAPSISRRSDSRNQQTVRIRAHRHAAVSFRNAEPGLSDGICVRADELAGTAARLDDLLDAFTMLGYALKSIPRQPHR